MPLKSCNERCSRKSAGSCGTGSGKRESEIFNGVFKVFFTAWRKKQPHGSDAGRFAMGG